VLQFLIHSTFVPVHLQKGGTGARPLPKYAPCSSYFN